MAWRTWHGIWYGWQTWHCIWYGLWGMAWYMVWPGRASCGIWYYLGRHGMIYGMACQAWYGICYGLTGIWYGLADMAWYMVWPGGQWHGLWYDLAGNGMVYGMAWQVGGPVHTYMYRTRSQIDGPLLAHSIHMYSSCSCWAVTAD